MQLSVYTYHDSIFGKTCPRLSAKCYLAGPVNDHLGSVSGFVRVAILHRRRLGDLGLRSALESWGHKHDGMLTLYHV